MAGSDLFTHIKAEARKLLRPRITGLFALQDPEPGTTRTYSLWGWQRFPTWWVLENSNPELPENLYWLEQELKARGYLVEYTQILEGDKE